MSRFMPRGTTKPHYERRRLRSSQLLLFALLVGLIPTTAKFASPVLALASSAYASAVEGSFPSLFYPLNETSGTTATDEVAGNNATYGSGVTLGQTSLVPSTSDTAVLTPSSSSTAPVYSTAGTGVPTGNSSRTFETWVQTTNTAAVQVLFGYGDFTGSVPNAWSSVFIYNGDQVVLGDWTGGSFMNVGMNLDDGVARLIDVTYDSATSKVVLYINGEAEYVATLPFSYASIAQGLAIGSEPDGTYPVAGTMQDAAIYATALTPLQIDAHYDAAQDVPGSGSSATQPGYLAGSNPSVMYRFNETSGDTAHDASGSARNAIYGSGVTLGAPGLLPSSSDTSAAFASSLYPDPLDATYPSGAGLPTGNSDRTIEVWFETTHTGVQMIEKQGPSDPINYLDFTDVYLDGSNSVHMGAYYYFAGVTSSIPFDDGRPHLLDVVWDGGTDTMKLYIDGQHQGNASYSGGFTTATAHLSIGNEGDGSDPFIGNMQNFAIFPSTLSSATIAAHYAAGGIIAEPTDGAVTPAQLSKSGTACTGSGTVTANHDATNSPVNTESGDFWHTIADISIAGRTCPLAFTQTYSAQAAVAGLSGPLGYGWTDNYGMSLAVTGTSPNEAATVTNEDGSLATFDQPASGSVWPPSAPRFIATLTYNSGSSTWTYVRQAHWTYTFNSSGELTSKVDLNGYTTAFAYTSGKLTTVTDPAGRTLTINWTGSHITSVVDANVSGNTRTVSFTYSGDELTDITDVNGGDTHFTYDGSHRMTNVYDPVCESAGSACNSGNGVQTHYDSSNRVDWQKDQLGRETTFAYTGDPQTAGGGTTLITDPASHETLDGYEWGLLTNETIGYGTSAAATTYDNYDPDTLVLSDEVDPNGGITSFSDDSSGNILTSTDPLGRVTTTTYNAFNEPLTVEDPNSVTTTNTYDANGNLTATSTPLAGTAQHQVTTYNHADATYPGDLTSVVDADGKTTSFQYDSYGNRIETKDPLGNVTGTEYNADDWLLDSYSPKATCTWGSAPPSGCSSSFKTAYSYVIPGGSTIDEFGQVQTITDPLANVSTVGYDADGHTTSTEDGNGNTTTTAYDLAGEACWTFTGTSSNACASPPSGASVTDYNADGTVADQKDGAGNALLSYTYTPRGQVATSSDALSNVTTYTYGLNGNVLTKKDPGGSCTGTVSKCTTFTYDADNELKTASYSDTPGDDVTATTYDADGQKTAQTDGTGSSSWSYDSLHRLTSYSNGHGDTVSYGFTYGGGPSYELLDRPRTIVYPNSVGTVTEDYDDAGNLLSVKDWNAKTTAFAYDADDNLSTVTDPSTTNVVDTYGYDDADGMTSVGSSNGTSLFAATYTRDSDGQLATDSSQPSNQSAYQYTAKNQLCYAGSASTSACASPPSSSYPYAFDSADNLTTDNGTRQQFDAADELCWAISGTSANACGSAPTGATTFNYSDTGNRTSEVLSGGSAICDAFNQANELTSIKTGTGSSCSSPTTVGTYSYDGSGLRESKTVSGTTMQFTWDESGSLPLLLQEKDGAAAPISYIYGPGGIPVEEINGSTSEWLHHDQLGSIRLITDSAGATGTATTTDYDPYGNVVSTSGSLTSAFGFAGQYVDAESGLVYLGARYYDASMGQFLSQDPAVAKTASPYAYALGDPLNFTDPSGLASCANASGAGSGGNFASTNCGLIAGCMSIDTCVGAINEYISVRNQWVGNLENAEEQCEHADTSALQTWDNQQIGYWQSQVGLLNSYIDVVNLKGQQVNEAMQIESHALVNDLEATVSLGASCAAGGVAGAKYLAPVLAIYGPGDIADGVAAVGGCAFGGASYVASGVRFTG